MTKQEKSKDDVIERIRQLINDKGCLQDDLAEYIHVKKQVLSNWMNGANKGYRKHLSEIAEFFSVTTDYLLYGTEAEVPTLDEKRAIEALIKTYSTEELREISSLSRNEAKQVVDLVQSLLSKR